MDKPSGQVESSVADQKLVSFDCTGEVSIAQAGTELKDVPIDLLFNNAGIYMTEGLEITTKEMLMRQFEMDSIAGSTWGGNYSYGASKAAVNMVNFTLAIDLKKDIVTTIVVHPGYVLTDLTGGLGDVHTDESVRGMASVIEKVTMADMGKFYHFQGHEMPW